jgi:competence protein ComEA
MSRLPRSQLLAYAIVAVAVLVVGGPWLARGGGGEPQETPVVEPAGAERGPVSPRPKTAAVIVHVSGAVRRPGVYRLPASARVRDAVRRAGGPARRGDANAINLAALVQDGAQVLVPQRAPAAGAASAAAGGAEGAATASGPVNLNTATAEELETLEGVGPVTAADIIEYRTQNGGFRTVDDLDQVSGIGPKTMEALRDKVVV